jgi:O-antigen/teichoic acid export membrane protein
MGPDYAAASARPLQILAVGVFFNGLALIPFSLIQGAGRPDLTAKLHMAELPVYAAMLAAFIYFWGITGVALAWSVRTGIDLCLLLWVGRRLAALRIIDLIRLCGGLAASLALLAAAFVPHTLSAQLLFVALVLVLGGMLTWRFVLQSHERRALLSFSR